MLKLGLFAFILLLIGYLFLEGRLQKRTDSLPVFLTSDQIVAAHHTNIQIRIDSKYKPNDNAMATLKKDYAAIWAHLNYLYATNATTTGKEYYTENWFKQICSHYTQPKKPTFTRTDSNHYVHLINWATDGLVATLTDSVHLNYHFPERKEKDTVLPIAVVLLFEGDHWRIDAMQSLVLPENTAKKIEPNE